MKMARVLRFGIRSPMKIKGPLMDPNHLYKQDVAALSYVGFHHYRFSISWPRVLNGTIVNQKGIDYYNALIDSLIEHNIRPVVTLYHWDLPQYIQDNLNGEGGILSTEFAEAFKQYADVVFEKFGDRVKDWITFNEPYAFCVHGYETGNFAPGKKSPGVGPYLCAHHVLQAHAATYHLYKEKYFSTQNGSVGICLNGRHFYKKDENVDKGLIDVAIEFQLGWFAHPIFSQHGGYPQVMIDTIDKNSAKELRNASRLPVMSDEMRKSLIGAADYLGFNYYTSRVVEPMRHHHSTGGVLHIKKEASYVTDTGIEFSAREDWNKSDTSSWMWENPEGIFHALKWIKRHYNNPRVLIAENGYSDAGALHDIERISYIKSHLHWISKAIEEEGCNVEGYTVWSLIDNFEWLSGYTEKFGVFHIDFDSENKTRTPKSSAEFFKGFIENLVNFE